MSDENEISEANEPITYRQKLQDHLKALDEFIGGPAYIGYKSAREREIQDTKDAIILVDPIDRKSEIESYKMRGELRVLEELLTTFEDARVTLKQRIEEMLEREQQKHDKQGTNDN